MIKLQFSAGDNVIHHFGVFKIVEVTWKKRSLLIVKTVNAKFDSNLELIVNVGFLIFLLSVIIWKFQNYLEFLKIIRITSFKLIPEVLGYSKVVAFWMTNGHIYFFYAFLIFRFNSPTYLIRLSFFSSYFLKFICKRLTKIW